MTSNTNEIQGVSFLRHEGWIGPADFADTIHIIGCGAVGSHIAVLAAKMGAHKFVLWDSDVVESHNLANQAYDVEHIGQLKVDALTSVLKRFNPAIQIQTHPYFFETSKHKQLLNGPVVIATDTMSARYDLYDAFKMNAQVKGVFEVRLAFDYGEVHTINNLDLQECKSWFSTLKDDSEIPDGPCNLRICTTLVQLSSSMTVHNICSRYAALRQQIPWKYTRRVHLSLTDQLRISAIK